MEKEIVATFNVAQWLREHREIKEKVHVSQPREVACWTRTSIRDGGKVLHGDLSGMPRCETFPPTPTDLNDGYPSAYVKKQEGVHPGVEPVVEAISRSASSWEDCHVCTFRNNLNKIGKTPFDAKEAWEMDACTVGNTLFLDIREASEKAPSRPFPDSERFCYYGYKFEALCCGETTVDATSEYCAVMRIRIGKISIMFGAEIDCCDTKGTFRPPAEKGTKVQKEYIEFKTHRLPQHPGQQKTLYKFKYPRWWLQSWLAGVPRMLVGGWDGGGILRNLEVIPTTDLPKISAKNGHSWDPWQSITFLHEVIEWMQQTTKSACGRQQSVVVRFVYGPAEGYIRALLIHGGDLGKRVQVVQKAYNANANDTPRQQPSLAASATVPSNHENINNKKRKAAADVNVDGDDAYDFSILHRS